jgi:uncharacterized RDD family membrane protein YckC
VSYVGVGRRALAIIIDGILFLVVTWPIESATHAMHNGTFIDINGRLVHGFQWRANGWFWLLALIWVGYMTLMEGTRGASLGKLALGIRVAKLDGTPMDLWAALVRNLLRIVDGLFVYLVGAILVWTSPQRQRLGDRAAQTVVILAGQSVARPVAPQQWAAAAASPPPIPPPPPRA